MSAGNFTPYSNAIERIASASLKLPDGDFYAFLLSESYSPNKTKQHSFGDVKSFICSNRDHHPVAITGMRVTRSADSINISCDSPVSFGESVTITAKYFVLAAGRHTARADTDPLLGYCDLRTEGGSASSTSGPFAISIDPAGLFSIGN